jgi:hypothetical protein
LIPYQLGLRPNPISLGSVPHLRDYLVTVNQALLLPSRISPVVGR